MKRTGKPFSRGGNASLAVSAISLYAKELRRFLGRRVHRRWDVEDLAQEVYLRLLGTDSGGVEKPLEFMLGVARHVLMDHFRTATRQKQAGPHSDDTLKLLHEQPSDAIEDRLEDGLSVRQELTRALSQLSPGHTAVLVLFHRDGLTYEEIARKLGLTVETVHTYLRDARRQIRMTHWSDREGTADE